MANWKLMAVAGLKREREQVLAGIQPELDRIDKLIEGFSTDGAKPKVKAKGKSRSEAAKKMWETRRAKSKLDKEAHARTEARMSAGARLTSEAAAG